MEGQNISRQKIQTEIREGKSGVRETVQLLKKQDVR